MPKKLNIVFLFTLIYSFSCGQNGPTTRPHCINPGFDKKVENMISFSIPTIGVQELREIQNEVYIFDVREEEEYEVSHIKNARYLGYQDFLPQRLNGVPKDAKIVLYCSIGYRSEKIGEKLSSLGYNNVVNLYGSIFEWVNRSYPVVDKDGNPTKKVHTYNRQWSKWVDEKKIEITW